MKKESNVADGERGDLADFLVTEVALELEVDHFALVGRELLQGVVNPGECLARVVPFVEVAGDRELLLVFDGVPCEPPSSAHPARGSGTP